MARPIAASASRRSPTGRRRERDGGQVLVLFALSITVLFGAAGLAFDIGRFYSERRFLQNAADAAALAAANALIRGETDAQADIRAREVLTENFLHSPNGVAPTSKLRANRSLRSQSITGASRSTRACRSKR
ncbi:MAG TPA: pilus assembly protein TadG-related protein [Gammaproteobacteria bacterium]|nr:pilus assembly protein TadG-related protein [Gammaproteobacteria bacterium]